MLLGMLLAGAVCFYSVASILSDTSSNDIRIAVVDLDGSGLSEDYCEALSETGGLRVTVCSAAKAKSMMTRGQVESLLYIDEGFEEAIISDGQIPIRFVTGSLGVSGEATREILGGKALSMQSALDALKRLDEDYDLSGRRIEKSFYKQLEEAQEESVPILNYVKHESADPSEQPVFGRVYARFSGFAALVIFLFVMSLSVMISGEASKTINRTCAITKGGRFIGTVTDTLALFSAALLLSIVALLCKGGADGPEWLAYIAYGLCIAGICTALSFTRAGGGIDMTAPLFALITGVIGGCFFDIAALGSFFKALSYCTPQGLLIGAVAGDIRCTVAMAGAGIIFTLISYLAARKQ